MTDIATRTVKHDGKLYAAGSALPAMAEPLRQALIDAGALESRTEPPKGKAKECK